MERSCIIFVGLRQFEKYQTVPESSVRSSSLILLGHPQMVGAGLWWILQLLHTHSYSFPGKKTLFKYPAFSLSSEVSQPRTASKGHCMTSKFIIQRQAYASLRAANQKCSEKITLTFPRLSFLTHNSLCKVKETLL